MNTSARVDVVLAGTRVTFPAPTRIIVIAPTKEAGHTAATEAAADGAEIVAIVTPRSHHAARGTTADEILEAEGLTEEQRVALLEEVTPALATTEEQ